MSNYKQVIKLPDRVTQSVYDLPCVHAIFKGVKCTMYTLFLGNFRTITTASAGDYLAEDHQGKWHVLTKKQGEQYLNEKGGREDETIEFDPLDNSTL